VSRRFGPCTVEDIVEAMTATSGNVALAAARMGTSACNLRVLAKRRGLSLAHLRVQVRSRVAPVLAVSGDALPSARHVLAAALVDVAQMGVALHDMQAALEHERRITASLVASLHAVGAHLERTQPHG